MKLETESIQPSWMESVDDASVQRRWIEDDSRDSIQPSWMEDAEEGVPVSPSEKEQPPPVAAKPNPRIRWIVGFVLLAGILVIGGIVGAVLATRSDDSSGAKSSEGNNNPLVDTPSPTAVSSSGETPSPSDMPSSGPSANPSKAPNSDPTTSPSDYPTQLPSMTPTMFFVPPNPVPINPLPGYFNYDINDPLYGPDNWKNVDTSNHPIREFGVDGWGIWKGHFVNDGDSATKNVCGRKARRQSPKNLIQVSGGEGEPGVCEAGHEIRTKCGAFPITSDKYKTIIYPHKLSLVMNRRPCINITQEECLVDAPPRADYPKYSSGLFDYSDLLNYDIKVPAEHTLEGVSFDAEIQMMHTHFDSNRVSSLGIPIRATADGYNEEFQTVLDRFEMQYSDDQYECANPTPSSSPSESPTSVPSSSGSPSVTPSLSLTPSIAPSANSSALGSDPQSVNPVTSGPTTTSPVVPPTPSPVTVTPGTPAPTPSPVTPDTPAPTPSPVIPDTPAPTPAPTDPPTNRPTDPPTDPPTTAPTPGPTLAPIPPPTGEPTEAAAPVTTAPIANRNLRRDRELQQRWRFNPYNQQLMPGMFFYRYDGSITEPPCFPLTWWVMMEPMIISIDQLNQMKYLLFTHIDGKCQKTSVHNFNQEVARPIQALGERRGIQKCGPGSFESDIAKGRGDGNQCP